MNYRLQNRDALDSSLLSRFRRVVGSCNIWLLAGGICIVAEATSLVTSVFAEEKKGPPLVKAIAPLGIVDGMTVHLSIRGFRLGDVTGLKFPDLKTLPVFKIKSKGSAPAINRVSNDKIGDTQVDVELLLAIDTPPGPTTIIVLGPNGQSEAREIIVLDSRKAVTEREPNDGFSEAQEFSMGQTIAGVLSGSPSRDVYAFSGEAGQRVKIEVQAAQLGSLLEPFVLIHGADGDLLKEVLPGAGTSDPIVEMTLAKAGRYFISIRDAKDAASPMYAYLVRTRAQ